MPVFFQYILSSFGFFVFLITPESPEIQSSESVKNQKKAVVVQKKVSPSKDKPESSESKTEIKVNNQNKQKTKQVPSVQNKKQKITSNKTPENKVKKTGVKSKSNKKLRKIIETVQNYSGISLELNYGALPAAFTGIFLQKTHSLYNKSFALSFIWNAKHVKIYIKGLFWKMDDSGENWLASGHDWKDAAFVELNDISFMGAEVFLEGNVKITNKLNFTYGAGLGGGVFQGKIKVFKAQGCNEDNWRTPDTNPSWGGCYHNPDDYDVTVVDFPAGMPIVEAKLGLFYQINSRWSVSVYSGILFPGLLNAGLSTSFWF